MTITIRAGVFALALVAAGAATTRHAHADQEHSWVHYWAYVGGPSFNDFHATYAGSGGSIEREVLTSDPLGGGAISAAGNTIDIVWPEGWIESGSLFSYEFNTWTPNVSFHFATLTKDGKLVGTVDSSGTVVDIFGTPIGSFEHVFAPAPSAIVLLAAAGVVARRRRTS